MKFRFPLNRYNILLAIIFCYLIPLLAVTAYGAFFQDAKGLWDSIAIGFFLSSFGALILFYLMAAWENGCRSAVQADRSVPYPAPPSGEDRSIEDQDILKRSLAEAQQTQVSLLAEIDHLSEEIRALTTDKEKMAAEMRNEESSLEQYKKLLHQELEQQQYHIRELQGTIADQKTLLEKKQQQMTQLESRVADLTNEIKTLLQFAEKHAASLLSTEEKAPAPLSAHPPQMQQVHHEARGEEQVYSPLETKIQSGQEASQLLKRCLETAQRITGSQRFGSQIYSFLESPADSFALDLRRLCDRLRTESGGIILLYSPRENHVLFASNEVKALTGWSPEKFTQHFDEVVVDDAHWKQGVNSLAMRSEAHFQMQIKVRSGQVIDVNVALGMIPTGIFRNHTVAILYACSSASPLQNQLKY